jgi:hypothetical protein
MEEKVQVEVTLPEEVIAEPEVITIEKEVIVEKEPEGWNQIWKETVQEMAQLKAEMTLLRESYNSEHTTLLQIQNEMIAQAQAPVIAGISQTEILLPDEEEEDPEEMEAPVQRKALNWKQVIGLESR